MKINLTAKRIEQLRQRPGRYRDSEVRGLLRSTARSLRHGH
jgi:hypothetical protein